MNLPTFSNFNFKPEYTLGFLVLVFLAFGSSMMQLPVHWSGEGSAGYNHGYLVLASSIYLLYLQRKEISALLPTPTFWALLPLLLLSLIWFLASTIDIQTIQFFVLPFLLIFMAYVNFGFKVLKLIFIPVIIVLFALPIWQPALPILQDITTFITHQNIKLVGRPVFVEGNIVHVSGGDFFIDVSCSGLRFLLVSTILSLMNSNLNNHTFKQTVSLLSIVVVLSFLANWIRVFIIIMLGDFTKMEHSLVHDHLNFGWMVYIVATLIPYFLIARRFKPNFESTSNAKNPAIPFTDKSLYAIIFTVFAALSGPALLALYTFQNSSAASAESANHILQFSTGSSDPANTWTQLSVNNRFNETWNPDYQGNYQHVFTSYIDLSEQVVDLHIIHYPAQTQDSELINVINSLSEDREWEANVDQEKITVIENAGKSYSLRELQITPRTGQRRLMWYWYDIGGERTTNNYLAKLFQVRSLVTGRNDASLLAASIQCLNNCESERKTLESFIFAMDDEFFSIK